MAVSDVEQPHSADDSTFQWLSDYASGVWNSPQDHLIEIGITGVAAAAALTPVGRIGWRALSEGGSRILPERALSTAGLSSESPMSAIALKQAVSSIRNLSHEVDSGFSPLVGKITASGDRVITTSDHNAFRLLPLNGKSSDAVYAHELVLPRNGDKFTARFLIDAKHKNSWTTADIPAWPIGKSGIWANLDIAGLNVRPAANDSLKLEFTDKMAHLDIASQSGHRINIAIDHALTGNAKSVGQGALSNSVSNIRIEGPSAVRSGNGLISVRDLESKVASSEAFKYPEIHPGGTLRIYRDPNATILPILNSDVRLMTPSGLLRHS